MHDPTKVLLGATGSNLKDVSNFPADPAVYKAGYAVRLKTDGTLSKAVGDGNLVGVSLGRSLSDTKKTAVVRTGNYVPLRLKIVLATLVVGDLTFTAVSIGGEAITIALVDGDEDAGATVEVTGTNIVVTIEDGVTTAETIAAAILASEDASELVTVEVAEGEEETVQAAAAEAPLADGEDVAVVGAVVKLDTTTGEAAADGAFTSAATFLGTPIKGVDEDGTEVWCAFIAMPGGF